MELCIFDVGGRFAALLARIENYRMVALVEAALPGLFFDAPGAMKHHHAYRHGLSLHTVEVAEVALSMLECSGEEYGQGDIDILLTAALLHDIAKCDEYHIDENDVITYGDFTIGHVVKSVLDAVNINAQLDRPVAYDDMMEIASIMLAHHGFADWGTPKNCAVTNNRCSLSQAILHSADMVSAGK